MQFSSSLIFGANMKTCDAGLWLRMAAELGCCAKEWSDGWRPLSGFAVRARSFRAGRARLPGLAIISVHCLCTLVACLRFWPRALSATPALVSYLIDVSGHRKSRAPRFFDWVLIAHRNVPTWLSSYSICSYWLELSCSEESRADAIRGI